MCKVYKALGHVYDSKILDMVFFLSLLKGKKMTWTISFHNDWTDFVVVLIFLTYFKTYSSCFLLPYCKTILWKTLFFAKKIKKRKKKNIPRHYEVYKSAARHFSCRTKRKRAIPWGHDMTWHNHTARSCRQSEDRITVITITLRTKWYGCHIVLGVFMATFSTLNIVQWW